MTKNAEDPADNSKVGNRGGKSDVKQDQDKSENDKGSLRIHINLDLDVEVHISGESADPVIHELLELDLTPLQRESKVILPLDCCNVEGMRAVWVPSVVM